MSGTASSGIRPFSPERDEEQSQVAAQRRIDGVVVEEVAEVWRIRPGSAVFAYTICFGACRAALSKIGRGRATIGGQSRPGCTMRESGPSAAAASGTSFHAGATAPAIVFLSAIGERCHTHR